MLRLKVAFLAAVSLFQIAPSASNAQGIGELSEFVTVIDIKTFCVKGARNIGHVEALELNKKGTVFIDVRQTHSCELSNIPGAKCLDYNVSRQNFTQDRLLEHVSKDQAVVFYGENITSWRPANASALAITWGYANVFYFAGGFNAWRKSGYPKG